MLSPGKTLLDKPSHRSKLLPNIVNNTELMDAVIQSKDESSRAGLRSMRKPWKAIWNAK